MCIKPSLHDLRTIVMEMYKNKIWLPCFCCAKKIYRTLAGIYPITSPSTHRTVIHNRISRNDWKRSFWSALIRITPKEKTYNFLREFLSEYDKKTKNALKEIRMQQGKTKSQALQEISLKLRPSLQEKNIINLSLKEIEEIIKHYTKKEKH